MTPDLRNGAARDTARDGAARDGAARAGLDGGRQADLGDFSLADFSSADAPMRACLELAKVAARTELPVLILGESGTGKTLLARAIHNSSRRARAPFVSFNAAALSDTLLDSQLFGHEKGAFTGALKSVRGKFEMADRGTLFIDEIADMTHTAQVKILRAVEYGEFERLGSDRLLVADVRLISATHLPLQRYKESDQFRKDLFYRISGITLSVPALRHRPNDLRALIAAEIAAACRREDKEIAGLSRTAAELLFGYHWPGNLRELKRVIHSAVAMTEGEIIQPDVVLLEQPEDPALAAAAAQGMAMGLPVRRSERAEAERRSSMTMPALRAMPSGAEFPEDGELNLRAVELRHIHRVLQMMGGNKRRTARALGVSRSTLDRKLRPDDGVRVIEA